MIEAISGLSGQSACHTYPITGDPGQTGQVLGEEQKRQVEELKAADAKVRRHEQAHLAAAGTYALGAPSYEYKTGPDGKRYAVSGEVRLDVSSVPGDPAATIRKAQTVRKAALAPADPSPQDRRVAAEATRLEMKARQELARQQLEEALSYDRKGRKTLPASNSSRLNVTA